MLRNVFYNEDCFQTMARMADKCCDVFTDPKYNVGKDYGTMVDDNMPVYEYKKWIACLFKEFKRIANTVVIYTPHKWQSYYWSVLGQSFHQIILTHHAKNGFYHNYVNKIAVLLTNAKPERSDQIENIWYNMQLPGLGYFGREEKNEHPGYTTLQVTETAIKRFCKSDLIYDPQMGSGTTALAARRCKKDFIGSELNPRWVDKSCERLKDYEKQIILF